MLKYQVRSLIITGIICTVVSWGVPSQTQELMIAEPQTEETEPQPLSTALGKEVTTQDPEIEVDELKLLVKPLTRVELENEAAAWLILLKQKVQEISDAEIAVKRQNRAISKQQEAANTLEEVTQALEAAQESQAVATVGSPEYEQATRKIEEAQENLKKAQEAVEEAAIINAEIKEDDTLSSVIEEAQETGELEQAKQTLELAKKDREKVDSWSSEYEEITQNIDQLEIAIETVEEAQEIQKNTPPDTWEYDDATQQLEAARNSLKQAIEAIQGVNPNSPNPTEQSSQNLDEAVDTLENTNIEGNLEIKVASTVNGVENLENIDQKQNQLEEATEQLEENAEAESELKNQLVSNITELQAERTAIIDRFEIVLDELEKKGGEVSSYNDYIQAVSTIEIDLEDTDGLGVRLMGWLQSEEGGLRWGIKLGTFVSIVIASIIISQIIGLIINRSLSKFSNVSDVFRQLVVMLVKRGGVVVGFVLALTALEVSLGPLIALVGGTSFILAFALQNNLANLASGFMLMVYKPFDVEDEVLVGDISGFIHSITLANTIIRGWNDEIITMPNNTVWGSIITNMTTEETRCVAIVILFPFSYNISRVEQILREIAKSHPLALENPAPKTVGLAYTEYSVKVKLKCWATTTDYFTLKGDLHRMIQQQFDREGIVIALPTQEIRIQSASNNNISQLTVDLPKK
ncbi:mechanosensitive ion channel domain-containing protein [Lyngbya sp. PCC 8106]|uniref:mechanosensitive ion channel domain-containing protein n=1 Tax=Lyngbya sp. (strain PCC 8106) TaxID=313612 RepID=UPI0000EAC78A|nr:mechanosensitive ion channel domain-containing protein [Lyngbya sp. PCC 8106]EAW38655.1 small conductance mechanosensitive ion channel [Lyngbya sp. PCC 8106]